MSRLIITGITEGEFQAQTKAALEATLGSPIKKDRVVRQFLSHQLHGGDDTGQNEHNLAQFFAGEQGNEQNTAQPSGCRVVTMTRYEPVFAMFAIDSLVIEDVCNYLCMTDEAVERTLTDLFRANFPDHDGVTDSLMDARLIENYLDEHDEDGKLANELANMPSYDIEEWLLETFSIEALTRDEGIRDILWMDRIEFSVKWEEIHY